MATNRPKDIVVIGGSMGALGATKSILNELSPGLPAAVFIAIHSAAESPEYLAEILGRSSQLAVRYAADHDPIEIGQVYIAPPDRHLLVKAGEVRVIRGPKENGFRPAIDPLFRTAAHSYDGRVIGIVLSGMLDDGTQGIGQIRQRGGTTIVQSSDDATERSMPESAKASGVDHVLPANQIGELINSLTSQNAIAEAGAVRDDSDIAEGLISGLQLLGDALPSSPFICPDCGGAMWQLDEHGSLRFRCHTGHGYYAAMLLAKQGAEIEQALWSAIRLLEEQAELQRRMANKAGGQLTERYLANANERMEIAAVIRSLVLGRSAKEELVSNRDSLRQEYVE